MSLKPDTKEPVHPCSSACFQDRQPIPGGCSDDISACMNNLCGKKEVVPPKSAVQTESEWVRAVAESAARAASQAVASESAAEAAGEQKRKARAARPEFDSQKNEHKVIDAILSAAESIQTRQTMGISRVTSNMTEQEVEDKRARGRWLSHFVMMTQLLNTLDMGESLISKLHEPPFEGQRLTRTLSLIRSVKAQLTDLADDCQHMATAVK